MSLRSRLILRFSLGMPFLAAMLFIPAGTWRFWQGWTLLAIVFTLPSFTFLYFYKNDRPLLERRLRSKEKLSEQKRLIQLLKPAFFAVLVLPGFDYRLGWSPPNTASAPASASSRTSGEKGEPRETGTDSCVPNEANLNLIRQHLRGRSSLSPFRPVL